MAHIHLGSRTSTSVPAGTTRRRPRSRISAAGVAAAGLALALGAPAAGAQSPGALDPGSLSPEALSTSSLGATSVGAAAQIGSGAATGSLPGQCAALGSLGFGERSLTEAVPGENPGQTVFLVDQNLSSEGSTTTDDVVIRWTNEDTGASGELAGFRQINWIDFRGDEVWGAVVDTGAGTVTWTMDATENGLFVPTASLDFIGVPTGSTSHPYGGCGGTVVVP